MLNEFVLYMIRLDQRFIHYSQELRFIFRCCVVSTASMGPEYLFLFYSAFEVNAVKMNCRLAYN